MKVTKQPVSKVAAAPSAKVAAAVKVPTTDKTAGAVKALTPSLSTFAPLASTGTANSLSGLFFSPS